jgi:hypothetical protein
MVSTRHRPTSTFPILAKDRRRSYRLHQIDIAESESGILILNRIRALSSGPAVAIFHLAKHILQMRRPVFGTARIHEVSLGSS